MFSKSVLKGNLKQEQTTYWNEKVCVLKSFDLDLGHWRSQKFVLEGAVQLF